MDSQPLQRARDGDERAFDELVAPHVRELHLHCYRMLGSVRDAEDLLQETLLAAWSGLHGFAGRSSLRTWLYRIATHRCLNAIRDGRRRAPAEPRPPFDAPQPSHRGEITWLQPYPDAWLDQLADPAPGPAATAEAREWVELAFIAALQRLPPRQTAVLVLHDVLGFSSIEIADMLDTGPTAVKGILQRARAATHGPAPPADTSGTPATEEATAGERDLARRFARAFGADDIDGVIGLLTDDAWLAMPPAPHEYHGAAAIAGFLRASIGWRSGRPLRLVPTGANRQPAFAVYLTDPVLSVDEAPGARFAGILVITPEGSRPARVAAVTRFLDDSLAAAFGLPARLDAGQPGDAMERSAERGPRCGPEAGRGHAGGMHQPQQSADAHAPRRATR